MNRFQKISLFFLRVSLGWMFFYAGITKVLDPSWSALSYLNSTMTFSVFYHWLGSPNILPFTNFINEWGLTLLGISLIFGIFVRPSSLLGAILMILYYFALPKLPYPNPYSYIVDEHVIFIFGLLYLSAIRAGKIFGLDGFFRRRLG